MIFQKQKTVKMRLTLLIVLFISLSQMVKAQNHEWAPIGAEWHYTHTYFTPPFPYTTYYDFNRVNSVKDSLFQGKTCRYLVSQKINCSMWFYYTPLEYFMYQDSGKVYHWDNVDSSFILLMDFNKNAGESWEMPVWLHYGFWADTATVFVDSVTYLTVGSDTLKQQHVTYYLTQVQSGAVDTYNEIITERFGHQRQLLPLDGALCDGEYDQGLRCYSDSSLGFYNLVSYECDSTWGIINSSVERHDLKEEQLQVYPNPAQDFVTISFDLPLDEAPTFYMYDFTGKLLKSGVLGKKETQIDIDNLPKGVFLLEIVSTKDRYKRKFTKL
jgi:hypothetical protein